MDRERARNLPELEIELHPAGSVTGPKAPDRPSPTLRSDRRSTIVALVVALVVVVVAFVVLDGDRNEPEATPSTTVAPLPVPATATAPSTTVWVPPPALLGATDTNLMLWSFDGDSRLQWVDLDSGEVRHLNPQGGAALFPLDRGLVVSYSSPTGDARSTVINTSGDVLQPSLSGILVPVPVLGTMQIWLQSADAPRRWQLHRQGPGVIVDLSADAAESVVPYDSRVTLLVTRNGTSSFDTVTRQQQLVTTTPVIAAGGGQMIGRTCSSDRCALIAIDFGSPRELMLRSDIPIEDTYNARLSPDGRYLAITRKSSGQGRFVEIIDIATSLAYWHSPDGVSFTGVGPSWSWSPDSTRFFVTMSANRVIAVDVRNHPFRQVDIDMPHTPFHGIAVTQR